MTARGAVQGPASAPSDAESHDHVEALLQRVDALPTLSPIATRVLELSGSSETDLREVVDLVRSDPALSAKLLALCKRADLGLSISTVDRAVVVLGLEAVRAAVLSIQVFEVLSPKRESGSGFDHRLLWIHAVATACAAEVLAESRAGNRPTAQSAEAFVCGLLHDLGKLALDTMIPKAFERLARVCDTRRVGFAAVARQTIGLDHHTVGKRIAERWRLPHTIQDTIWLHGQPPEHLPDLPHRELIRLVIAADLIVQRLHLGWSGEQDRTDEPDRILAMCGLPPMDVEKLAREVHRRVDERASALGLTQPDDPSLLVHAISAANRELGALSQQLTRRADDAERLRSAIASIDGFLRESASAGSLPATIGVVGRWAASWFGAEVPGVLWQHRAGAPVELVDTRGGMTSTPRPLDAPIAETLSLGDVVSSGTMGGGMFRLMGAAARAVGLDGPPESWRLVAIPTGGESGAALIVDGGSSAGPLGGEAGAVIGVWGSAIAGAARHDGARRLGERLAVANEELAAAQARVVETRSMARLATLAAGAAHEMNTPLAVISGNAQRLLAVRRDDEELAAARRIVESADRLSGLISALHFFADPPAPEPRGVSIESVVWEGIAEALRRARHEAGEGSTSVSDKLVTPRFPETPPVVRIDAGQVVSAITEVVLNAIQSGPRSGVVVEVHPVEPDGRLVVEVADDGVGMDDRTLARAFDPFFSAKEAGRRTGLGLTRARRLVELHGGDVEVTSEPGEGTIVRLALHTRRWEASERRESAAT